MAFPSYLRRGLLAIVAILIGLIGASMLAVVQPATAADDGAARSSTAANLPPHVSVGVDQTITLADQALLLGYITDDGLPVSPGAVSVLWSQVSGPGLVTFENPNDYIATASFSEVGTYVLRLTASDGELSTSDDLIVTVNSGFPHTILVPQDYPTIQDAIDAAQDGDLVLVAPGTYEESLLLSKTITLASTYYTTGDESLIAQTQIHSPSHLYPAIEVSSATGMATKIVGFTFQNGDDAIKIRGKVKVLKNHMINQVSDGVDLYADAVALIQDNTMDHNDDDGIDIDKAHALCINNLVWLNGGDGVEIRTRNNNSFTLVMIVRDNIISTTIVTVSNLSMSTRSTSLRRILVLSGT